MTVDAEEDAALVARAVRGDHAAFAVLARRHGPRMARTVRALGVSASEVEDVTQTSLLAAWRGLADYDPKRPFVAWACVIAANKARDWRRYSKARRPWLEAEPLDRPEALAVRDGRDADTLADRGQLRRVANALDRLPEHLKVPLVLISAGGLTQQEAADALGISRKAVETRVARGRARLIKALRLHLS